MSIKINIKKDCGKCHNPFEWKVIEEGEKITKVQCFSCKEEFTIEHNGLCVHCGFWLDEDDFCEMCD